MTAATVDPVDLGEYRVQTHPDEPGRILVTWRPDKASAVGIWVAVTDDIAQASAAMVAHREGMTP